MTAQRDTGAWTLDLETLPQADLALQRVSAWFGHEVVDRVPVRFSRHNAQYDSARDARAANWRTVRDRWFDAEYQVDAFLAETRAQTFRAETFPVFWPNLGPDIYAGFFGATLEFGEITSWSRPAVMDVTDDAQIASLRFSADNAYYRKIEELSDVALAKCRGKALIGVTCWCPGIDCVAAWRGPQELCMDLLTEPERVHRLLDLAVKPFPQIVDAFYRRLSAAGQPSVGWMNIPAAGRSHISQTDFASVISPGQFAEFCLPSLRRELGSMDRNIFHLDGKGVARHLETILELPEIDAVQWVQGVGDDAPILQWVPLIRRIQQAGKSVVVDLRPSELEEFIQHLRPEGLFLCVDAEDDIQDAVLRRVAKW